MYSGAVKTIAAYAESMTPSEDIKRKIGGHGRGCDTQIHMQNQLSRYRPDLVSMIVPPLYRKFPSLRTIIFGSPYYTSNEVFFGQSWIVRIPFRPSSKERSREPNMLGNITVYHRSSYYIATLPPKSFLSSPPPSCRFTINDRYDLSLCETTCCRGGSPRPSLYGEWGLALAHNECFGDLYKSLDTGGVEISLDTLISIYLRQSARGHMDRLERIKVTCLSSWDLGDFQRFAIVASRPILSHF